MSDMSNLSGQQGNDALAVALFSEIMAADQLIRTQIGRALPKGMELSHFSVLNHLFHIGGEKTPAQLAKIFHVTKGAMTNTLRKLENAGAIHIRPDWDDGRRKLVSISDSGLKARNEALEKITPIFERVATDIGPEKLRQSLPLLRTVRSAIDI